MADITLYGPNWSAYTRTARLTLEEKKIAYELKEVDFSSGAMPPEHFNRHPFGKVPVLAHGSFMIYETSPICRYVEEAFDGPVLQPRDAQQLGRMVQIISVLDTYLSVEIRMGYVNELFFKPMTGLLPDEDRVTIARQRILKGFSVLGDLIENGSYFTGQNITLADLHAAPLFDYLDKTPGGDKLIDSEPGLRTWWILIKNRPSMVSTEPDLSVFS